MDPYEATKTVFSRIQNLDPENASKIMGLLLIQDHGEKEMIRLAFGPENLLHSVVVKARHDLGISATTTPTTTPSTPTNLNPFSRQNSSTGSSRFLPNGLKIPTSINLTALSTPSSPSWAGPNSVFPELVNAAADSDELLSPGPGSGNAGVSSGLNPSTPPFYGSGRVDLMDEVQLQEQLSFLNENGVGPTPGSWGGLPPHKRSCSVNDINIGSSLLDDPACMGGLGWKPCMYYARGFCKNGSSCRFVHGGETDGHPTTLVGSPSKLEMMKQQCQQLLRSKSMQHHKLMAAAAMANASPSSPTFPYSFNKGLTLFAHQQQNDSPRAAAAAAAAAALMMGEEMNKFNRSRLDNGRLDLNPASRQIYLTFPADSTFSEEDVSNYFSLYGPVQDVRIPYQQKRMFGFVTFVYPDTVKMILAKGNPHFVCDARVLVKPYKEKGKVPDKFRKQQQPQMERGEFSACNSPTALDSRDTLDLQLGARMLYDTHQYMLWRRKLEQEADLQQAIELQSRRLMGLQLLDVKRNNHHRSLSTGAPIQSPTQSPNSIFNQPLLGSDRSSPDAPDEICGSPSLSQAKQALQQAINEVTDGEKEGWVGDHDTNSNGNEGPCHEDNNIPESLEHNLPDSPFASPMKGANQFVTAFSGGSEADNTSISANSNTKASSFLPSSSTLDLAPLRSCYFQMPRFSAGHGAVGM